MEESVFKALKRGDIVKHKLREETYIVSGNYGQRATALASIDMENPGEWDLVLKANFCGVAQNLEDRNKLSQAHFDALPTLLQPLIECKNTGKPISASDAISILHRWDKARTI